jgi:hypothetical protein
MPRASRFSVVSVVTGEMPVSVPRMIEPVTTISLPVSWFCSETSPDRTPFCSGGVACCAKAGVAMANANGVAAASRSALVPVRPHRGPPGIAAPSIAPERDP